MSSNELSCIYCSRLPSQAPYCPNFVGLHHLIIRDPYDVGGSSSSATSKILAEATSKVPGRLRTLPRLDQEVIDLIQSISSSELRAKVKKAKKEGGKKLHQKLTNNSKYGVGGSQLESRQIQVWINWSDEVMKALPSRQVRCRDHRFATGDGTRPRGCRLAPRTGSSVSAERSFRGGDRQLAAGNNPAVRRRGCRGKSVSRRLRPAMEPQRRRAPHSN